MDLGLEGRSVFITGGSGGLGGPMARVFADEGAHVALTYHRNKSAASEVAEAVEKDGGQSLALPYDLGDEQSIRSAVDTVTAEWGGIDVLVVNASPARGPDEHRGPFETVPVETWRAQLREEVEGAFHTVQAVVPGMKARGWGRIVLMSASIVNRGMRGEEAYVASKAALHGLNRTLATELVGHGILSNAVAPGPTVTANLLPKVPPEIRATLAGLSPAEIQQVLNERIPQLRFGLPEDVARVVAFLGSDANRHVTGSVVNVAGGH